MRVPQVEGFDAVILGSAVYLGRWPEPARKLAESFSDELRRVPVWPFSLSLARAERSVS